jgi:hypothetical protein
LISFLAERAGFTRNCYVSGVSVAAPSGEAGSRPGRVATRGNR